MFVIAGINFSEKETENLIILPTITELAHVRNTIEPRNVSFRDLILNHYAIENERIKHLKHNFLFIN